jgi:GT2 family glycosyltransferase
MDPEAAGRTTVVMITRNRCRSALDTLERLAQLPERPPVIVVDNGSSDGTAAAVRDRFPSVEVHALGHNLAAAGRTVGVAAARTPYVAFCDDDSWWSAGSLSRAADLLDQHPRMAVLAARVLVDDDERLDPVCAEMAASPLPSVPSLPGPPVLGFVACGSIVRREAFLANGGFRAELGIGGEEELLALDLVAAGWSLVYVDAVVAHHHPAPGERSTRLRTETRNALWVAWWRLSFGLLLRDSWRTLRRAVRNASGRSGIVDALRGWPNVRHLRRVLPAETLALRRAL